MQVSPVIFNLLTPAQKCKVGADHFPVRTAPQFPDDAAYMKGWNAAQKAVALGVRP